LKSVRYYVGSIRFLVTFIFVMTIIATVILSTCSCNNRAISEPRDARQLLEKVLVSIANNDYETYISYIKQYPDIEPEPQNSFEIMVIFWKESLGDYIYDSARFSEATIQDGRIEAYYFAKFSKNTTKEIPIHIILVVENGKTCVVSVGYIAKIS
jgi:hypothetical protein